MEEDLNLWVNGRRPQFVGKWKSTLICWRLEDNPNFWQMEDKHIFYVLNGRRPQLKVKLAYLALASTELGTAQPQLVPVFITIHSFPMLPIS